MAEQKFLTNLDVAGTIDLNNLTINSAQGTDGQVLTSTGSGIAWEDASGGTSLSGGAANKLAVWNSATTLTNDTNLHWNTTNDQLGIGNANPQAKLDITQNQTSQGIIIRSSSVQPEITFIDGATGDSFAIGHNRSGSRMDIEINGTDTHTFKQNGNVGFGTTNPTRPLVVSETRTGSTASDAYTTVIKSVQSSGASPNPGTGGLKVQYTSSSSNVHAFGLVAGSSSSDFLTTGPMHFYTNSDLDTVSATGFAMQLDTSQRLILGSMTASQKLNVSGNVTANRYYENGSTTYYLEPASNSNLYSADIGLHSFDNNGDFDIGDTAGVNSGTSMHCDGSDIKIESGAGFVYFTTGTSGSSFGGDLTVSGGDIILGGTGRIQGIDTVSANTDAVNKQYVDNAIPTNNNQLTNGAGYITSFDITTQTDGKYLRSNAHDTFTGKLSVGSTSSRSAGIYGIYDSYKTGHIWSIGTAYDIPNDGSNFGNLYGLAYKHTNNTTGGTMGGSHQMVWCDNGSARGSIGYNAVWHAESMKAPIFYDSANTGYYLDPASTGLAAYLRGDIEIINEQPLLELNDYTATSQTNLNAWVSFQYNGTEGGYVGYGSDANSNLYLSNYNGSVLITGASAETDNSFRAPIFYDTNDTGYYVNPNSTSRIKGLEIYAGNPIYWYRSGGNAHQRADARLDGTDAARLHWYGKNDSSANTGFKHAWYDGSNYINVTAQSDFVYFDRVSGTAHVQSDGSFRAPTFYDSNNTAYYVDPGYTSFLKDVNVHGTFRFQRSATTQTGQDDNVTVTVGDSDITFKHNNDNDGDASVYNFQYTSGGNAVNIFNLASNYANFTTPYVRCNNNSTDYAQLESNSSGGVLKAVSNGNTNVLFRSYGDSYTTNNFGIGTSSPVSNARLTVVGGNQTFGIPGNGTNTSGRWLSFEGNTDSSGEGSGRLFFSEHNSSTTDMDDYGMSIGYRGGSTSVTTAGGNTWTGLSAIANGQWGMWGHDNSLAGTLIMAGPRSGNYVVISQSGGIRAQIFYDSNNTSYYTNPASTSVMNIITTDRINMKDVGDFITFYGNDNDHHSITSRDHNGSASDDIRINSYHNVYFNLDSNNNNTNSTTGIYVGQHGSGSSSLTDTWTFYSTTDGITKASGSFRAPVFYDSNNTAYYAHLDSTADSIRAAGDIIAFYSSDKRYKENVKAIESPIEKVKAISGVTFEWNEKSHKETGKKDIGVIAQEVEEVLPEIVQTRNNGYKAVDYQKLTAVLIEAVKEQQKQIDELKSIINGSS